jgi:hypothetical protein
MARNAYPTLEQFEIARRELARPNNDPMPEPRNRTLDVFGGRLTVAVRISPECQALELVGDY